VRPSLAGLSRGADVSHLPREVEEYGRDGDIAVSMRGNKGRAEFVKKGERITPKQAKFVKAYVETGNATEAAAIAGYSGSRETLAQAGSQNIRKPAVQNELEKALAKYSAAKVVEKLGEQAEGTIADFIDVREDGSFSFDLNAAKAAGKLHLIRKLKHDAESGAPVVELHDQQAALKELARIHGLSKDDEKPATNVTNVNILTLIKSLHPAAVAEIHRALLAADPEDVVDAEPSK
jgi:phage terminase small subunit